MSASTSSPQWMLRKERGNLFWLRVMSTLSVWIGRRPSRVVLYGIALYFVVAASAARKASRNYLDRCLGRRASWLDVYRHVLSFASTIHDRVYLLNDRRDLFDLRTDEEELASMLKRVEQQGAFLLGAHVGSFEVLRSLASAEPWLKLSVAMYPENARRINQTLAAINPKAVQDIIALGHVDSMLRVNQALRDRAVVGILADRAVRADQPLTLPFLGAPAQFATGPFRLAALMKRPVYFMVGLYRGGNRYDVHFELIHDPARDAALAKDAAVREMLTRYVDALERHCRSAPYNWFNFYDFWESDGRAQP
ncbi:MAG: LpxL/LpxP family acyltransferase [Ramlibacter sp.]